MKTPDTSSVSPKSPPRAAKIVIALVTGVVVFVVGLLLGVGRGAHASGPPVVVFVSASSPLGDISKNALRRAFLAEPTVVAGVKLLPLNQNPGSPDRVLFDSGILDLSPDAMSRFWIDQRIRGQGNPPRAIPSAALLTKLVGQLPGAISYARANEVPAGSVKVLSIDGKAPGSPGYPLN